MQREPTLGQAFTFDEFHQQQSALDTLAEVSRRHLDYSTQNGAEHNIHGSNDQSSDHTVAEQALVEHLQHFASSTFPTDQSNRTVTASSPEPHLFFVSSTDSIHPTSTFVTSGLVQTASQANQHLKSVQESFIASSNHSGPVDPHLDLIMGGQVQTQTNIQHGLEGRDDQRAPGAYTQTAPGVAYSPGPPPQRVPKKVRGQFSDGRRKEVANVRKTGACLRCRVLKKPCSGETPCTSCNSIATARVWKDSCTRTRLVDELTLYSTQLFYARASLEVSAAGYGFDRSSLPGRIEVRCFPNSDLTVLFPVRALFKNDDAIDQGFDVANITEGNVHLLLDNADKATDRVGLYAQLSAGMLKEAEDSLFMKSTVEQALALAASEAFERIAQDPERKSDQVQKHLPDNVLELWVLTRLLSTPDRYPIQLRYSSSGNAGLEPAPISWEHDQANNGSFHIPIATLSYHLIRTQLLASIETRCKRLSTDITNEIERRLLQRRESSQFTILISTVILLNCIERMTGFFVANDLTQNPRDPAPNGTSQDSTGDATGGSKPAQRTTDTASTSQTKDTSNWPVHTPASTIWRQGPPFATLLSMLLRLRNLPPRTGQTSDGTLAVIQTDFNVHNGRAVEQRQQEMGLTNAMANWLDPLRLSVSELIAKRDAEVPTKADGIQAWDMVFISKILLGERVGSL